MHSSQKYLKYYIKNNLKEKSLETLLIHMNLVRGNNYKFQKAHILLGAKNNLLPGNIQSMFSVENIAVI